MSLERMRSPVNSSLSARCIPLCRGDRFYTKAFLKAPTVGRHPPATPQFSKSVCFLLPHSTKRICHWLPWLYVTGKRYPPDSIFSSDFHCPLLHKWKKNWSSYSDTKHAWLCFCKWQMLLLCQVLLDCNR
jgi:hypothetical protein